MKLLTLLALLCVLPAGAQIVIVATNRPGFTYTTNGLLCISGSWPTNIVISNDFTGTIQVGTNFMTGKELHAWMKSVDEFKKFAIEQNEKIKMTHPHPNRTLGR